MNESIFRKSQEGAINYYAPDIVSTQHSVCVKSTYNKEFADTARQLGGVFDQGSWVFSRRDEVEVRTAAERYYGYDGLTEPAKVDVQIDFKKDVYSKPNGTIWILARPLARAYESSRTPQIAHGTVIKTGSIETDGDRAVCKKNTALVLRDVPIALVDRESKNDGYLLTVVKPDTVELELLFYEHDRHVERIREIESLFHLAETDIKRFGDYLSISGDL